MACASRASNWFSASESGAISSGIWRKASGASVLASRARTSAAISRSGRKPRPTAIQISHASSGISNSSGATVRSAICAASVRRALIGWAIWTTAGPSCTL
ncbi:hypothetical protein D3C87_1051010 [compost metagenome]